MGDGDFGEGGEDGGCQRTEQDLDIREWRGTQSTETFREKKKSQGWGKMTKPEEMKTLKHTESSDLMRPLKMLRNKQQMFGCACVNKQGMTGALS